MPNYTLVCLSCDHTFKVTCSCKVRKKQKCPKCQSGTQQVWHDCNIYVCEPQKTLGSLADQNNDRMSQDERDYISDKNNSYNSNYKKKIDE